MMGISSGQLVRGAATVLGSIAIAGATVLCLGIPAHAETNPKDFTVVSVARSGCLADGTSTGLTVVGTVTDVALNGEHGVLEAFPATASGSKNDRFVGGFTIVSGTPQTVILQAIMNDTVAAGAQSGVAFVFDTSITGIENGTVDVPACPVVSPTTSSSAPVTTSPTTSSSSTTPVTTSPTAPVKTSSSSTTPVTTSPTAPVKTSSSSTTPVAPYPNLGSDHNSGQKSGDKLYFILLVCGLLTALGSGSYILVTNRTPKRRH